MSRTCCRACDELSAAIDALVLARDRVRRAGERVDVEHRLDRRERRRREPPVRRPTPTFWRPEP